MNVNVTEGMELEIDGAAAEPSRFETIIERELPRAVDKVYDQIGSTPAIRSLFLREADLSVAKEAQIRRWRSISSVAFSDCPSTRGRNQKNHSRVGFDLRRRIAGDSLIAEHLVNAIVFELWPKRVFRQARAETANTAGAALASLIRAVFLDMDAAIAAYLEDDEAARAKVSAEKDRAANEQGRAVDRLAAALARFAEKDLTCRIVEDAPEPFRRVELNFNLAVERLAEALKIVSSSADSIELGAEQVAAASTRWSDRSDQQATALREAASALSVITAAVGGIAEAVRCAKSAVAAARNDLRDGGVAVRQAVEAISEIEGTSNRVGEIVAVIEEAAFQTNLLALNGCIEAARAGDAGRGFAGLASEVRARAQQCAEAACKVKDLNSASGAQAGGGLALIARASEALNRLETGVQEIDDIASSLASRVLEQAAGLARIDSAAHRLDQLTLQSVALAGEAKAASLSLADEGERLSSLLDGVRFEDRAVAPADPRRKSALAPL